MEGVRRAASGHLADGPNSDFGLGSLAFVARMPADAGGAIFAIARCAGWIAHAIEEYAAPPLRFRGRALYTGPPPAERPGPATVDGPERAPVPWAGPAATPPRSPQDPEGPGATDP